MAKDYITKQDLKEFEESLENGLDKTISGRLNAGFESFRNEMSHMFKVQNEQWEQRFTAFESRMYTLIDPLMKEIETRQQDRELTTAQIQDLDKRVTKLENS